MVKWKKQPLQYISETYVVKQQHTQIQDKNFEQYLRCKTEVSRHTSLCFDIKHRYHIRNCCCSGIISEYKASVFNYVEPPMLTWITLSLWSDWPHCSHQPCLDREMASSLKSRAHLSSVSCTLVLNLPSALPTLMFYSIHLTHSYYNLALQSVLRHLLSSDSQ